MDANVYIAVEPFSGTLTTNLEPAARLLRNVAEQGHRLFVHPAVRDDISRDRDRARAAQRLAELNKYQMLDETPISAALLEKAGPSPEGSNDHRDLRLLAALSGHAVNYLVSEDIRLSRRAARAGLTDAVLTIAEAVALLDSMRSRQLPPPPKVESIPSYALDVDQPIFRSLQMDYPGFDEWLAKVQADMSGRVCFVVREQGEYEAIALTQSKIKKLQQGDVLLFYRSHDRKSVDAVGIVEQTYRSRDPAEIITFVGRRTVYTPAEITGMCRGVVPPLAILFRQDRFIDPPWSLGELVGQRVMKSWPQSITEVARGEGLKWIQDQLVV